ncbi:hypothetical protein D9758_014201 [Tetrapyrgos nigripes]|uniref:ATP-dependent DNA helicase n=1 Tax=Tetrapyrgos nigripes TaxID=182062 RepID=A0A8H5FUA3_9AGAR|nr:hypothetical protein D9758_014201 [Tetrapyrgos nigripes]
MKVYDVLPPPPEDLDEVLAIMFTGPCKPTEKDYKRTPMLVRRKQVFEALTWLRLNHPAYEDVKISMDNLNKYPEDTPPVTVAFKEMQSEGNRIPEATSIHDNELEIGTELGSVPFVVHGITGEQLQNTSVELQKAKALAYLKSQGKFLAVGHSEKSSTMFNNPLLYPSIFPWLFPYGMGSIGMTTLKSFSEKSHKKYFMKYHDQRFQSDPLFSFVAFSHEQVKKTTSNGFALTQKESFSAIADRILNLNPHVLNTLIDKLSKGGIVRPETEEEKLCYEVIQDLDHVGGTVKGSMSSKKFLRTELWSLISYLGAPSWYITFAPSDLTHPLCLYYAISDETFDLNLNLPNDERTRKIINNPVAGAKFFDFMVQMFIKHILGVDTDYDGVFGKTSGYFGTIEQQGRLTLHLHMLLWIANSLSPQQIRDAILKNENDFQRRIVEYLGSVHCGDFMTGTQEEVEQNLQTASGNEDYVNPLYSLPQCPPIECLCTSTENCEPCQAWTAKYQQEVDDILSRTHIHKCKSTLTKQGTRKVGKDYLGCLDNKFGTCKARFPRETFPTTQVDTETGALRMKKTEAWINTYNQTVTYLLRCNSDVSSLLSGTAIKAVVLYVTEYITKWNLNTHVIFEVIRTILQRNAEMLTGTLPRHEKARKIITQIVNLLTVKMELGAPMIALYLLDKPDHYTSHEFKSFYWKDFVSEARRFWQEPDQLQVENKNHEKVVVIQHNGKLVGFSSVFDYIYRPEALSEMTLYEWVCQCERVKLAANKRDVNDPDDEISERYDSSSEDSSFSDEEDTYRPQNTLKKSLANKPLTKNVLPKKGHPFVHEHPLASTHYLRIHDKRNIVLNFIGPSLPRRNKGDREYYCSVMLTFFKPWRTGKDLKEKKETWDSAFLDYQFSAQQKFLMDNFELRFECLDSRDDYHAQRKAQSLGIDPSKLEPDFDDGIHFDPFKCSDDSLGVRERRRQLDMQEMTDLLANTGWTNAKCDLKSHIPASFDYPSMSPAAWRLEIAKMKSNVITNKLKENKDQQYNFPNKYPDQVEVLDQHMLEEKLRSNQTQKLIDDLCLEFSLNLEQERAFRIVANHAVSSISDQLKMYIGGMAGTGKSQVLKTLREFFKRRLQSQRMIVVAPTGTAAALLQGSTYHSVFGINSSEEGEFWKMSASQICSRLSGVDYVFLDEVSMLSCKDMYKISAKIASALNRPLLPFGGMNMIFAGDFAQLPPAMGGENVSLYSHTIGTSSSDQHASIGKYLWHQINTVVLLRKNCRQTGSSIRDVKFRQALENMRYKQCTAEDITLLRSLISDPSNESRSIDNPRFWNTSIILTYNKHKDVANELGTKRFAAETGQMLAHFFSEDEEVVFDELPSKTHDRKRKQRKATKHKINDEVQQQLWKQSPSTNNMQIPATLSLCKGLPVMIRFNGATELCITKGQEGTVHGWQAGKGRHGQLVLKVLYVKLEKPSTDVQFKDLPLNVVPITPNTRRINCKLPDDRIIQISRTQVEVLPNFAMTDFASQGKTRDPNVVDIYNSRDFRAIYTALSRSSSADGTIILQGFNVNHITGGVKDKGGYHQELRELEILNDITKLRENRKLPPSIIGDLRGSLIQQYRSHFGKSHTPDELHESLVWDTNEKFESTLHKDISWKILEKENTPPVKKKTLGNFVPIEHPSLHSSPTPSEETIHPTSHNSDRLIVTCDYPTLKWSANSCAYDSALMLLYHLFRTERAAFLAESDNFSSILMNELSATFQSNSSNYADIRDQIRRELSILDPDAFPAGAYADTSDVLHELMRSVSPTTKRTVVCYNSHFSLRERTQHNLLLTRSTGSYQSTQDCVSHFVEPWADQCPSCHSDMLRKYTFQRFPKFFLMSIPYECDMEIQNIIHVPQGAESRQYHIDGIIYFGNDHFITRMFDGANEWVYDGIGTGIPTKLSPDFQAHSNALEFFAHKKAVVVLYVCSENENIV